MSNNATINISSATGSHKIFVQQDANNKRTINSSVESTGSAKAGDGSHILYECSANSDGNVLNFSTDIHVPFWVFYGDKGTLAVDVATSGVTLDIAQAGLHVAGVAGAGEAAAMVAFLKACKGNGLPDIGA